MNLHQYIDELNGLLQGTEVTDREGNLLSLDEGAKRVVEQVLAVAAANKKLVLVGNGGSAAIVDHMHGDFCKAAALRTMVFHDLALLTAYTNDEGYVEAFEKPARLWVEPDDLMMAVSSSGRSQNIVRAAAAAREAHGRLITFSGFDPDNPLRAMGDVNFHVASHVYGYVECAHMVMAHYLIDRTVGERSGG